MPILPANAGLFRRAGLLSISNDAIILTVQIDRRSGQESGSTTRKQVSLVVTDLDNTLFDWVEIWYASFSALLRKTAELSGLPIEQLEVELKAIHQRHGTTEYAFSLEELPSLRRLHRDDEIRVLYDGAIEAFREAR